VIKVTKCFHGQFSQQFLKILNRLPFIIKAKIKRTKTGRLIDMLFGAITDLARQKDGWESLNIQIVFR